MLSRRHLRIKALQALYAFQLSESDNLKLGENLLLSSLDKLHELFITQLSFIMELADFSRLRHEDAKQKYFPTPADLSPNKRFVENKFLLKLGQNKEYLKYMEKYKVTWFLDQEIVKRLLNELKESKQYIDYMASEDDSYACHSRFISHVATLVIGKYQGLQELLEDRNIFWLGDYPIALMLVQKTIAYLDESTQAETPLLPLIKTEYEKGNDDLKFILELFRRTVLNSKEYEGYIVAKAENWEIERIAIMDVLLMKMAICEFLEFSSIPVKVTMDEYIEISKYFSSPKSSLFINGILDRLVSEFKEGGMLKKRGRGLIQ